MVGGWHIMVLAIFFPHIHLAHSSSWKIVQVEIPQNDITALDKEVTEAHALRKNTTGGLEQINKTYSTIRKRWKNLHNVRSEPTSDVYHYVGSQQVRQNDLYLLMYQDEVKVSVYNKLIIILIINEYAVL